MAEPLSRDPTHAEAFEAARGLLAGEQALAGVLREMRAEADRTAEAYRAVVRSLAAALEARDGYTGLHSDFVSEFSVAVAVRLGLEGADLAELHTVALLHDIGKIGIPDRILHKEGPLDDEEWAVMRQHPEIGERILAPLPGLSGVARAVRHEHERWDGTGYPDGLGGEEIPLASRIVLACDAYSALVTDRPYRAALGGAEARAELRRCAGSQFDPAVVEALLSCLDDDGEVSDDAPADALERVVSGDAPRRFEREVQALLVIASLVSTLDSFEDLLERAAEETCAALGAATVSVSRWEAEANLLRVLVNAGDLGPGESRRPSGEVYRAESDDATRLVLLDGGGYTASLDDAHTFETEKEILRSLGRAASVGVPILFGGQPWGELWAARNAGQPAFGDRDVRFLHTVAAQVSAAVGRTELFARLAHLAYRDPLTGAGNRSAMEERLELVVADALEAARDVTLLLCDVDHLKEINDTFGHAAGDAALQAVAAALSEAAGGDALLYRSGGDEFCVVLDGVGAEDGIGVGLAVLDLLARRSSSPLTVSCGVASLSLGGRRAADLLRAADAAQYLAKRSGRGRVLMADPSPAWKRGPLRERRRYRRRGAVDVARLLGEAMQSLEGELLGASPLDRLRDVALVGGRAVGCTSAAVSWVTAGDDRLLTLFSIDFRTGSTWSFATSDAEEAYSLAAFPASSEVLERGGTLIVSLDDAGADPAEAALLTEFGMTRSLLVGIPVAGGAWLLEIGGDDEMLDLGQVEVAVRLLAAEAAGGLGPPSAETVSDGARSRSRG